MGDLQVKKSSNKLYLAWMNMRRRCNGDKHIKDSRKYVERGITYPSEWESFDTFYRDMHMTYRSGLSLDRINNEKGYSKGNCRWATPKEQANNTSRNRKFTIGGVTKNLAQWINESELKSSTVRQRFYGLGWSIEDSLHQPLGKRLKKEEIRKRG